MGRTGISWLLVALALSPLTPAPLARAAPDSGGDGVPVNPVDLANRRQAEAAKARGRRPEGILPLLRIWRSWDQSTPEHTLRLLQELGNARQLRPDRQVYARRLAALGRARLGALDASEQEIAALGYVTDFRVIGPFDNEGKAGLDAITPVEEQRMQAPDLQASYQGRERQVSWRALPDVTRGGYVDLRALLRPAENVCGLAETFVHTERARPLSLWFGAGGAARVYWNGLQVLEDRSYRGTGADRHAVMLGAHAGWNRLLVKVCTTDSAWGFHLRLGDPSGGVAEGLRVQTETTAALDIPGGHAKGVRLPRAPTPPLSALTAAAEGKRPSATALAHLARYLHFTHADDPAERRAKQLAARAAEFEPSLDHLGLAARLSEERGDVMRFAAQAAKQAPRDARARLLMASVRASGPVPEEGLPWLEGIPSDSDLFLQAALLRASVLRELELPAAAARVLRDARAKLGNPPALLAALADAEAGASHTDVSIALRRQLLSLRADDVGNRRVLIQDALERDETASVLEHIDHMRKYSPGQLSNMMAIAALYDALGRDDLRMATYRAAIEQWPEAARPRVALGHALLRIGDEDGAADAFFEALALKPQDAATRELLEQITPQAHPDEAYAVPSEEILARRLERTDYPTTTLHHLTVNTVYDNGLGSRFSQLALQAHDAEGARQLRTHSIQYDPDTQRVDVRLARVYRRDGRVLESMQTYEQQLGEPWYRIYYDTRALVVVFPDLEPGDVVELRYRVDDVAHRNLFADYYGGLHMLQEMSPIHTEEIVLVTPKGRKFYTNEPALPSLAHTRHERGAQRIDHWVATDVPALTAEPGMPGFTEIGPYLHISTYENWKDVGRWYWGLIKDQLYADESLKRTVAELVQGAPDLRTKVQRIHNWVLQHTRYVGLEFGIHGFLPYRVPLIVQRGFGDCKDKASLMYTMLREAGIDARIVLVRTRRNGRIEPLPASLAIFDHAIAYVPALDLFLDGTAEHSGTDELPTGDQGVTVLLVGPEGAELRRTPVYPAARNHRLRELQVTLAEDGSATLDVHETVKGSEAAAYRGYYEAVGTRAERFERALGQTYPGAQLVSQNFEGLDDLESDVRYQYRVRVPQLAHWDGPELRLAPSVLGDLVRSMARTSVRTHPLDLDGTNSYTERRSVRIPPGLVLGDLPPGGEAASHFGILRLGFEATDGGVVATTEFELVQDRVAAADYAAFRRWVEAADQLLKQRIQLRRGAQ